MYIIRSKARTLLYLKKKFPIPKLFVFKVSNFFNNPTKIIDIIKNKFKGLIAVRSSNNFEDAKSSLAGKFKSFLNIDSSNDQEVYNSILRVINSYKKYKSKKNEVFIQEMVPTKYAGVVTTCDISNNLPYICINYSKNNSTDVTEGKKNTIFISRFFNSKEIIKPLIFNKLIIVVKKILKYYKGKNLDIEFVVNRKNQIKIIQVRILSEGISKKILPVEPLDKSLKKIEKKITKIQKKHFDLFGNTTYFGVMPDWNPAEIIGIKPKPLALSMYQELVTDHVWSENRKKYGFQDLTSHHLIQNFFGTPYVDIRVDFNSWLPNDLNPKLKYKLVNYYLNKFKNNSHLHDKIEFDILFTCFTPGTNNDLQKLIKNNFSKEEITSLKFSLKKITENIFKDLVTNKKSIMLLNQRIELIKKSDLYFFEKIYWLVEDCKKYGTSAFSGLARAAFIAIDILRSLNKNKILSSEDLRLFFSSLDTVTKNTINDVKILSKEEFIKAYGHLRPSSYDINSKNYSEGYNLYFDKRKDIKFIKKNKFKLNNSQKEKINTFLKKNKVNLSVKNLFLNIRDSIIMREYGKFCFSKSIDEIFKNIIYLGNKYNIKRSDLAFLDINYLLKYNYNLDNAKVLQEFKNNIKVNKEKYKFNKKIILPDVILSYKDIYINTYSKDKINFYGYGTSIGDSLYLKDNKKYNYNNKIVCIENADPGYDFLFSKNLKGLITKYGGANSHMSIRCAELNLPSAIGVGEKVFQNAVNSRKIKLNIEEKKIEFF
jgi:hypothetical protein